MSYQQKCEAVGFHLAQIQFQAFKYLDDWDQAKLLGRFLGFYVVDMLGPGEGVCESKAEFGKDIYSYRDEFISEWKGEYLEALEDGEADDYMNKYDPTNEADRLYELIEEILIKDSEE